MSEEKTPEKKFFNRTNVRIIAAIVGAILLGGVVYAAKDRLKNKADEIAGYPTVTPNPSYYPTVTATPTVTASPEPTGTITPTITVSPTPTDSVTPTATLSPTITPTPTATPSISPTPAVCRQEDRPELQELANSVANSIKLDNVQLSSNIGTSVGSSLVSGLPSYCNKPNIFQRSSCNSLLQKQAKAAFSQYVLPDVEKEVQRLFGSNIGSFAVLPNVYDDASANNSGSSRPISFTANLPSGMLTFSGNMTSGQTTVNASISCNGFQSLQGNGSIAANLGVVYATNGGARYSFSANSSKQVFLTWSSN